METEPYKGEVKRRYRHQQADPSTLGKKEFIVEGENASGEVLEVRKNEYAGRALAEALMISNYPVIKNLTYRRLIDDEYHVIDLVELTRLADEADR